ncbi:phage minor tail U family protein [Escherichia coli]
MGLFTTRQLLGYTEQKVKFRALFLELFFRRTVNFHTEEVMLDKITGKTPVAAYVSPVVEGKVLRHRGGETRVLRPGYVKPKHEFNYQQAVERLPGEDPSQLNDPAYRRLRIITDNLKQEEHAIVQVEEMQAVNAVLYGKYTMEGDQFEKIEVDFGRSTKNNITQGSGKEWSKQDRDTFDPTHDIDLYCDQASGLVNIAIMDGTVWRPELRAAVLDALEKHDTGATFFDGRPAVFDEADFPAVAVYLTGAEYTGEELDSDTWQAELHIEVFLPAQVPDSELDSWMESRIYPVMSDIPALSDLLTSMVASGYDYRRDDDAGLWSSADLTYVITYEM